MNGVDAFDNQAMEYDRWFDENLYIYQSEIEAKRRFIPDKYSAVHKYNFNI